MLLDWTQLGYWRFNIELGTVEAFNWFTTEQFSQVVELSTLSQSRTCTLLCIVMFSQLSADSCHYSSRGLLLEREEKQIGLKGDHLTMSAVMIQPSHAQPVASCEIGTCPGLCNLMLTDASAIQSVLLSDFPATSGRRTVIQMGTSPHREQSD